jgi:hypothetical protein
MQMVVEKSVPRRSIIIGGGITGLVTALTLHDKGEDFLLLEGSDRLGGRLRTDIKDGYVLDHGFQVLNLGYPELQWLLKRLGNASPKYTYFDSGALIHQKTGHVIELPNPLVHPERAYKLLNNQVASLSDMFLVGKLLLRELFLSKKTPTVTTYDYLKNLGFSHTFIRDFWHPFLSGVFLEDKLDTLAEKFSYLFGIFAKKGVALLNNGIASLPVSIASLLPPQSIRLKAKVRNSDSFKVELESGEVIVADKILVTTPLLIDQFRGDRKTFFHSTWVRYFTLPTNISAPLNTKYLNLLPEEEQVLFVNLSAVNCTYAPLDKALIALSGIGKEISKGIPQALTKYPLKEIASFVIENALPHYHPSLTSIIRLSDNIWGGGDAIAGGTLNGAIASGRELGRL